MLCGIKPTVEEYVDHYKSLIIQILHLDLDYSQNRKTVKIIPSFIHL